jgi:pimeloyl-ACP methyl ester carboxylesterase
LLSRLRAQGYREGDWERPGEGPEYYVFLYDWRQSVESGGRRLFRKMAALRARQPAGTPAFVMVGHSIGGMLIRYALMYGDTPLRTSGPLPGVTWAGGALMSHATLVATPNEGTFAALASLYKGNFYRFGWGAFSPETLFTLPGIFDMIPAHPDPLVDPQGKPLAWDLNNPEDWERLRWSVFDPANRRRISLEEARRHLRDELNRKTRLLEALAAIGPSPNPVVMRVVGSDCQPVLRSGIVFGGEGNYKVRFKAPSGEGRERLRGLLFEPGDATISRRSLTAADFPHDPRSSVDFASVSLPCASHHKLMSSPLLLDALPLEPERIARGSDPAVETSTEEEPR